MSGPWANWDEPLEDQTIYIDAGEHPTMSEATEEVRRWIDEVGDGVLRPGRGRRMTMKFCNDHEECDEDEPPHWRAYDVWAYQPHEKRIRPGGPPTVKRCPECFLLVLTGTATGKTYIHSMYSMVSGRLVDCPGSKQHGLDPKEVGPRGHADA
jgi:hypothetical protein